MRILLIGAVEYSYNVLLKLLEMNANIVGVVTKRESKYNADFKDLSPICVEQGIEFKYAKNINHEVNVSWVKERCPDIIFCFGWSQLLGPELLSIPSGGVVGYHPAKLPDNRGRHPIIWALCLGLTETASTFFFMNEGADTGDILSQVPIKINNSDDAQSLYNHVIKVSLDQIETFLPLLESGRYTTTKQLNGSGNFWRKRTVEDGKIDWRMSAQNIYNLTRGLSKPYVGAHFEYNGQNIIVWKSKVSTVGGRNIEPGKVLGFEIDHPVIKCGDGSIIIEEMEPLQKFHEGDYL